MARILFKGSVRFSGADAPAIQSAAEALGYAAAAGAHTILLGSESKNTIDLYAERGVERFCRAFPNRTAKIEIHRPDDDKVPFRELTLRNLELVRRSYRSVVGKRDTQDMSWIVAHVGALDESDVLILIGGASGTELSGRVAIERRWTVLPVASFGGAAQRLFETATIDLRRQAEIASKLHFLKSPWRDDSAAGLVGLVEQLVLRDAPHAYFMSYSHPDSIAADRIELLLLRQGRSVLRDERDVAPGMALDEWITTRIAMASTFLAVHSAAYARSDYCRGELALAHELKRDGQKPRRIVALRLDDQLLPPLLAGLAWLPAADRAAQDAAVRQLIDHEAREPGSMGPPPRSTHA
jgi:hypothetical protein